MIYTLTFKHHGKSYSNFQQSPGKCRPNQYDAVAQGLILWKLEEQGLSRDDFYNNLCLFEQDETGTQEVKCVWTCDGCVPTSMEVKL